MTIDDIHFLIIGAAKSATTSLQRALQLDASVYMPDPELHYFSREYHRGPAWYLEQFAGARPGKIIGEKSNSYLDTPEAAARIHAALPSVRLIAQLRNPIERAYSDYCMLYRRAEVGRDIDAHLDPRRAADGRFLRGGLYHEQLLRFFDLFPRDQILVVFFEDFRKDPRAQVGDIRRMIGLPPDFEVAPFNEKVKDKTSPTFSPEVRRKLSWLKPAVAPFRQFTAFKAFRDLLVREMIYNPLTPELRNRLIEFYAPDAEKLGKLLDRDMSKWLLDTPSTSKTGGVNQS
jgi:hypothetical protein